MIEQRTAQRSGRSVVEENSHAPRLTNLRHEQALFGVFQNGFHLLACHTRKPFKKVVHRCAIFEVLEERRYRHARAFEQPRTADFARHALDRRTLVPIKHDQTITCGGDEGKDHLGREREV
jgi:hypothetical protein